MLKLKFGLIGLGRFGKHYQRLLNEITDIELIETATEAPEYLINNPEIDCVVIATPVSTHFDLAKNALEAGKHVLLEKPMVSSLAEAEELKNVVAGSNRVFLLGHQYLYNDYIRHLKSEIDPGKLGRINNVFAEQLYPGPIRQDIGCFWESATHELAIIDYLFDPGDIIDVKGKACDIIGNGFDDFSLAVITFESGLTASIITTWLAPEKTRRMIFSGEKYKAVFDEAKEEKLKISGPDGLVVPFIPAREPLRNEIEHFIDCVRNNKQPLTDIQHGVKITKFLDKVCTELSPVQTVPD